MDNVLIIVRCVCGIKINDIGILALPGYVAYRCTETGSWFIRQLVETFAEFACKEHVAELFIKVCYCLCLLSFDAL